MTEAANEPWMKGFDAYYEAQIAPMLGQLEQARERVLARTRQRILWVVPLVLLAAGLLWVGTENPQFTLFAAIAGGALGYAFIRAPFSDYSAELKKEVMTRLCRFFGLTFDPKPAVTPLARLRSLDLVPGYDRQSAEDRIAGTYGGVDLEMLELHLQERRQSRNRTYYVTVFMGPALTFSFPKRFTGRTVVLSDATFVGNWFTGLDMPGERVRLEDPEFERQFEVYGTDQVEARYLLTPGFMEALLHLKRTLKTGLQAAFDGGELLITANNNQNLFEADSWFKHETTADQVRRFTDQIGIVFRIIEDLHLRSRTRL